MILLPIKSISSDHLIFEGFEYELKSLFQTLKSQFETFLKLFLRRNNKRNNSHVLYGHSLFMIESLVPTASLSRFKEAFGARVNFDAFTYSTS